MNICWQMRNEFYMYLKACPTCGNTIPVGDLAVFAPKVDDSTCWHPICFTCSYCNEHLVDLTYCKVKGTDLYCERHYAEKMKRRCAACDEVSWHYYLLLIGFFQICFRSAFTFSSSLFAFLWNFEIEMFSNNSLLTTRGTENATMFEKPITRCELWAITSSLGFSIRSLHQIKVLFI